MKRFVFLPLIAALLVVGLAAPAGAIDKCKVKVDKKTGLIRVDATGVTAPITWGSEAGQEVNSFANEGTCVDSGKAKKCELAAPATLAAKTPPDGCTLYLADGSANDCSVWIKGCVPGSRSSSECGDGNADGAEACDGADLSGQTCQSAGFLYGTLTCDVACALDTAACTNDRYQDNGDGTVTDRQTNLMWEQKTGTATGYSGANVCPAGPNCGDSHHADNVYTWSTGSPYNPDGTAFTSFLAALNGPSPFAGHDDWRLATITELQSVVVAGPAPTIDPVFGPTQSDGYLSSSTSHDYPYSVWYVYFLNGNTGGTGKTGNSFVRAVRAGS